MRNILFSIAILTFFNCLKAQDTIYIHKTNKEVLKIAVNDIDSIKFTPSKNSAKLSAQTLSAKWDVSSSNSEYKSFEFDESGSYIVVKKSLLKSTQSDIVLYGTYKILDNNRIELSDFGILIIASISNNAVSLKIVPKENPTKQITVEAAKKAPVAASDKTTLLCRTWEFDWELDLDSILVKSHITVLFSKAGTYFVKITSPYTNEENLAYWKWKDENETIICYSFDGVPECLPDDQIEIQELTSTSLKIREDENIYNLTPLSFKKSSLLSAGKGKLKNCFLRK